MKIHSVEAAWLHVPLPAAIQHRSDFGQITAFDGVLVSVRTEDGAIGYGEAKPAVGSSGNGAALVAIVKQELAPLLVGQDASEIGALSQRMLNGSRAALALRAGRAMPILGRRGTHQSAIAGVDLALWDLLGKVHDCSVLALLGGACRPSIPAYASGGWASAERLGEELGRYVEQGFRAVKMRVGAMDAGVHASVARVRAARAALGPGIALMADAHGTWTVAEAKAFCRMVEDCDLYWLEEPVTADDKAGLAEVRRSSAVPISTGESEFTRHDFREIAELRGADVLQPDLAIAGGLTEGVRIGAIAAAYNLRLAPHLWSGAPAFAAGVALAASQTTGFILEYSLGANPLLHELVAEKFPVVDGYVAIPERPGLGITVDQSFVARYARQ